MNITKLFLALLLLPLPVCGQTEFSQDSAYSFLRHLVTDIGPRPMGSPGEHAGLEYAVSKFREYGCDTAYLMPMDYTPTSNTQSGVAVGIRKGSTGRIILIGGHMDSAGPEIPGADDDGSGSAVVIECCRILGHRPTASTMVFCCFGGEEQGLRGSAWFANHFKEIDSIALMLQVDMANGLGLIEMDPDNAGGLSAPRWLVRSATEEFSNLGYRHLGYPTHFFAINYGGRAGAGSDHQSFMDKGIPAIDFSTDVNTPIHTPLDNLENFDPRGLKRSGDLVLRLARRFDGGVPNRTLERYWLYLIGGTPFFLPVWSLWLVFGLAVLISVITLSIVWYTHQATGFEQKRRWSGLKIWLCTLIIVSCGWYSSNIVGLIRGVRFPWLVSYHLYYLLAGLAMVIGFAIAYRVALRLHITGKATGLYIRGSILLIVFSLAMSLWNVKLLAEPTAALLLLNAAILIPKGFIKLILLFLSPIWPLRLIFSEWDGLIFRPIAKSLSDTFSRPLLVDILAILFFTLYLLPFAYGAMAVIRQNPSCEKFFRFIASLKFIPIAAVLFLALLGYLLISPMYDSHWYKSVRATAEYDLVTHKKNIVIEGAEYLKGLSVRGGGYDTSVSTNARTLRLNACNNFDTSWVHLERNDSVTSVGNQTTHNILLELTTAVRPFTVSIVYTPTKENLPTFTTDWKFRTIGGKQKRIDWYSYPDTMLAIPISFTVYNQDSVREDITITFAKIACPISVDQEFTYVTPRTEYTSEHVYRKN